jgi:hypothetical protein
MDMTIHECDVLLPTNSIPHDLIAFGKDIVYVNSDLEIVHFNLISKQQTKRVLFDRDGSRKKWMRGLCIHNQQYIVGCGKTIQVLSMNGECKTKFQVCGFPCVIICVRMRFLKKF